MRVKPKRLRYKLRRYKVKTKYVPAGRPRGLTRITAGRTSRA